MFELTLNKLNCKSENAIHVGDMVETDVKGANNYKIKSVWFNDANKINSLNIKPDYEIKEISEVIEIVKKISD